MEEDLLDLLDRSNLKDTAVVWTDLSMTKTASFQDVHDFAERVALMLRESGVKSTFVGVKLIPDLSFPSILLGILKNGSAFVYLDPSLQAESWNSELCKKLNVQLIFTSFTSSSENKSSVISSINFLNHCAVTLEKLSSSDLTEQPKNEERFAFVCRTSGSTGEPKIVQVPHRAIVPNITFLRSRFGIAPGDVIFQAAPPSFDPSVVEIFLALSSHATLLMVPPTVKASPKQLSQVLLSEPRPSIIQATPSLIKSLGQETIRSVLLGENSPLRVLAFGGEICPSLTQLKQWKHPENLTTIFNLYGVTEVSCWSTCEEISVQVRIEEGEEEIPLGNPFPHTEIQVRDPEGKLITEKGVGELFISTGDRMCYINLSSKLAEWHATGDLVKLQNNKLYFQGRKSSSRIIKRFGQKISLDTIERVAIGLTDIVEDCYVLAAVLDSLDLVAFVRFKKPGRKIDVQNLRRHLLASLPSVAQPQALIPMTTIPLTSHGKVDTAALKDLASKWKNFALDNPSKNSSFGLLTIQDKVQKIWLRWLYPHHDKDKMLSVKDQFLAIGGDSVLAALVTNELQRWAGLPFEDTALLTTILGGTFQDVCYKLTELIARRRHADIPPETTPSLTPDIDIEIACYYNHVWKSAESSPNHPKLISVLGRGGHSTLVQNGKFSNHQFGLKHRWKVDLIKCIDASPLVLQYDDGICVAVIASHAGHVTCVDLNSGEEKWRLKLKDRVDASATASLCGQFIYLGCYDSIMYCVEVATGICCWAYQAGGRIRSSVSVLQQSIIFGDYGGDVYCLDSKSGKDLWWQTKLNGGAILASSCIVGPNESVAVIAKLSGDLATLDTSTGSIKWQCKDKDNRINFFASPTRINENTVLLGDVKGNIRVINATDGTEVWKYKAEGHLFSSFALFGDPPHIIFGTTETDGVWCLDHEGQKKWMTLLDGRVTGTPFVFKLEKSQNLVAVVSFPSTLNILDAETGKSVLRHTLPGETFSSPVVVGDFLLIGCRDNNFYCYQFFSNESAN